MNKSRSDLVDEIRFKKFPSQNAKRWAIFTVYANN